MRPPRFWYRPPGWQAALLSPLAALYARETAKRVARPPEMRASVPVICVGNINAGGTGKTPTVTALVQRLGLRGRAAHVVSRGYGGSLEGPVQVDERRHSADQVGDEPLLHAAFGSTWVARDRAAGVAAAVEAGAEAVILDDGFQNPAVAKDLSLLVADATVAFGNNRVIPAGPLREPVQAGLARADLLLTIGGPEAQARFAADWDRQVHIPQLRGALHPLQTGMVWQNLRVLAFAGIGNPEKFFATLRDLGANVHATHALSDHQPLTSALFARLKREAQQANAQLVTTEKDAVRLSMEDRRQVLTVPVRLELDDWAPLDARLEALGL
ncbi:tetraacyldisaccharide 4'-kinase [Tranquillimonas alkanivorans]|uniref:Tetraacyldisaccharide 4'-kinase n=1 Tax=Tranquillimonas alkanivorans TaxID=441119 RepID=A0A1I5L4J3_9RHOB|nr:tetraacyldisaccharide 4'-kinase [Tranquillimonas alkanivorans]SFO92165.1 lipid-A-disaccharide kinase [Tranquillimonas alkanivorans]